MYDIATSIVVYNNDQAEFTKAIESAANTKLNSVISVIDNSPTEILRELCVCRDKVDYTFVNRNLGFGSAHNVAVRKLLGKTKYCLIMNPDVHFNAGTLEKLFDFMEANKDIGLVMPKVLYPNGSVQHVCRLLPNPCDLFLRKFSFKFLKRLAEARNDHYELKFADYDKIMDVPYLSGCFMFIRADVLKEIGFFDERFFMYFEDVDLSRRIGQCSRTVYYPEATIYHGYEKGSDKNIELFKHILISGFKYFNKWGWLLDKDRSSVNNEALRRLS